MKIYDLPLLDKQLKLDENPFSKIKNFNQAKLDRKIFGYTSALTLPLILAACGGGGGWGAVSPTPDAGSGSGSSSGSG